MPARAAVGGRDDDPVGSRSLARATHRPAVPRAGAGDVPEQVDPTGNMTHAPVRTAVRRHRDPGPARPPGPEAAGEADTRRRTRHAVADREPVTGPVRERGVPCPSAVRGADGDVSEPAVPEVLDPGAEAEVDAGTGKRLEPVQSRPMDRHRAPVS